MQWRENAYSVCPQRDHCPQFWWVCIQNLPGGMGRVDVPVLSILSLSCHEHMQVCFPELSSLRVCELCRLRCRVCGGDGGGDMVLPAVQLKSQLKT